MVWWLEFDGDGFDGDVPVRSLALRDRRLTRLCFDSWSGHTLFRLEDWWIAGWEDLEIDLRFFIADVVQHWLHPLHVGTRCPPPHYHSLLI